MIFFFFFFFSFLSCCCLLLVCFGSRDFVERMQKRLELLCLTNSIDISVVHVFFFFFFLSFAKKNDEIKFCLDSLFRCFAQNERWLLWLFRKITFFFLFFFVFLKRASFWKGLQSELWAPKIRFVL